MLAARHIDGTARAHLVEGRVEAVGPVRLVQAVNEAHPEEAGSVRGVEPRWYRQGVRLFVAQYGHTVEVR